jgi:hypothetical protein
MYLFLPVSFFYTDRLACSTGSVFYMVVFLQLSLLATFLPKVPPMRFSHKKFFTMRSYLPAPSHTGLLLQKASLNNTLLPPPSWVNYTKTYIEHAFPGLLFTNLSCG